MLLENLLESIEKKAVSQVKDLRIKGIKYDSREVVQGDLFVAIKGFQTDGHQYIENALENGAVAVVLEDETYCTDRYPWILVSDSRLSLAQLSAAFFDYPSRKFTLIGVTGTNGKTTTTNLIARILEDAGYKVGLIGTIHNRIGSRILPGERTTPESLDLQKLFREMTEEGVTHVVMEVSSHALDLHRVTGSEFDLAVFTNLTQDHLDYHKSMEDYYQAKAKLFLGLDSPHNVKPGDKYAIVNTDDLWGKRLLKEIKVKTISYGIEQGAFFRADQIKITPTGVSFLVDDRMINLKLTGKFNVYNSLAALAAVHALGIPLEKGIASLEKVTGIPGRFQLVEGSGDITVIVDYAHTPDSLENILATAREFAQRRIITVFGCGGNRDRTKRPLMGKAAARYSDFCIITSDNPRNEEPEAIIEDILSGLKEISFENYRVVVDRRQAITEALNLAEKGDIVIIAGKGHETYQEIKGKKYPFDDKQVAEEILSSLRRRS